MVIRLLETWPLMRLGLWVTTNCHKAIVNLEGAVALGRLRKDEKHYVEKAPGEGKVPFGLNPEGSSSQVSAPNVEENGTEAAGPQNGDSRLSSV